MSQNEFPVFQCMKFSFIKYPWQQTDTAASVGQSAKLGLTACRAVPQKGSDPLRYFLIKIHRRLPSSAHTVLTYEQGSGHKD